MMKNLTLAVPALSAVLLCAGAALAQPRHLEPASLLIYPLFDSRPESATVINVTNVNQDRTVCDNNNGFRRGDVLLHYVYYGKQADGSTVCLEFDRFEPMTPADTLSVIASDHNPEGEVGFLVVTANDPETGDLIVFDHLIGSAYVANSAVDIMWSYTPYAFNGFQFSADTVPCGTDRIAPAGSDLIFDGAGGGYSPFPDELMLDSFFQEEAGVFDNSLTLMSTSGQDFINEIDIFTFNNIEERFSRTFKFVCHTTVRLSEISAIVRTLGGDEDEFEAETGWMRFQGRRILDLSGNDTGLGEPAMLAVFVQIVRSDFTAGRALQYTGTQNTRIPILP